MSSAVSGRSAAIVAEAFNTVADAVGSVVGNQIRAVGRGASAYVDEAVQTQGRVIGRTATSYVNGAHSIANSVVGFDQAVRASQHATRTSVASALDDSSVDPIQRLVNGGIAFATGHVAELVQSHVAGARLIGSIGAFGVEHQAAGVQNLVDVASAPGRAGWRALTSYLGFGS